MCLYALLEDKTPFWKRFFSFGANIYKIIKIFKKFKLKIKLLFKIAAKKIFLLFYFLKSPTIKHFFPKFLIFASKEIEDYFFTNLIMYDKVMLRIAY